jgi:hypothetical protein
MSKLKMEIYAGGLVLTLPWPDEEQYELGKKFLAEMGAMIFEEHERSSTLPIPLGGRPMSAYLKTREQLWKLFEFQKSLRERQQT